jgi:hypothetical protein
MRAEGFVGQLLAADSQYLEFIRQPVIQKKAVKGRDQFSPGKITPASENNE